MFEGFKGDSATDNALISVARTKESRASSLLNRATNKRNYIRMCGIVCCRKA